MIFYRTGQSWFPRKLDSLEPGKLVLSICNSKRNSPWKQGTLLQKQGSTEKVTGTLSDTQHRRNSHFKQKGSNDI